MQLQQERQLQPNKKKNKTNKGKKEQKTKTHTYIKETTPSHTLPPLSSKKRMMPVHHHHPLTPKPDNADYFPFYISPFVFPLPLFPPRHTPSGPVRRFLWGAIPVNGSTDVAFSLSFTRTHTGASLCVHAEMCNVRKRETREGATEEEGKDGGVSREAGRRRKRKRCIGNNTAPTPTATTSNGTQQTLQFILCFRSLFQYIAKEENSNNNNTTPRVRCILI